jgi:hypothetical protein
MTRSMITPITAPMMIPANLPVYKGGSSISSRKTRQGGSTYLELPDLYLPVVTVWLITFVLTPPPPESSSLVVLVPLTLLDVLAVY